jgi:hypothetical protein
MAVHGWWGGGGSMVVGRRGSGGRRWTGQRGCWVLRGPRGFGWLNGGGSEVATHGGSMTASTVAQWHQKGGGGRRYSTGGGAPLYWRQRRLEKGGASCGRGRW